MIDEILMYRIDECLDVLKSVESGKVKISLATPSKVDYCGNAKYRTDNGWEIVVFIDSGEWDYVDSMISPFGDIIETWDEKYRSDDGSFNGLQNYRPTDDVCKTVYGID